VVLAIPVAPGAVLDRLRAECDELIVLATPEPFFAVGEWYRSFDQTADDEVVGCLARAATDPG
jgi:putative phosphoribosyl transferase